MNRNNNKNVKKNNSVMQQRYNVSDPIASGTYGTIHQCTVTQEYSEVLEKSGADIEAVQQTSVVKIQRHDPYFWDNFSFLREIDALMRTRSFPGTVDVLDCVLDTERECAFIVMDQYDGTLLQFINQVPFDERMRHLPVVCAQLIISMAYLDRQGIAHRDIKPSNVLVQRAPMQGHTFTCHSSGCPGGCQSACSNDTTNKQQQQQRHRDCMKLFAPLLSSSTVAEHYEQKYQTNKQQQQQKKHPLQQVSTAENSTNIVLCDEDGTLTRKETRFSDNNQWLSSIGFTRNNRQQQNKSNDGDDDNDKMLIDTSELLDTQMSQDGETIELEVTLDEFDDYDDQARDADNYCADEQYTDDSERSDNDYISYNSEEKRRKSSYMRVKEGSSPLWRRQSRDFEKENSISVSLHASDGRPRSFPGVSFMQQRPHGLHSHTNCATADGETNTVLAGDLASLHRAPLVVICDFGLAKQLGPSRDTPCLVTLNFRPPEMFVDTCSGNIRNHSSVLTEHQRRHQQQQAEQTQQEQHQFRSACRNGQQQHSVSNQYRTNVDVWSLACVLLQYVTGSLLFQGTSEHSVMQAIAEFVGCVPTVWETNNWKPSKTQSTHKLRVESILKRVYGIQFEGKALFCDLLARMFHPCGTERPSATDLLTHPFIAPYVARTMRFMCSVTRQRPTFCSGRTRSGRVRNRPLHETSRWAFQTSVDVGTELLDARLGLQYTQQLTDKHRDLMCEWLWEQNRTLRYNAGTALASIHNFDRFMSMAAKDTLRNLSQSDFVLVGIICFYLTIHYYEQYVVDLPTLIGACGYRYEARQVKRAIRNVLVALHFQISTPSHWTLYCRHRSTMHMPHSMDSNVALLLYYVLRSIYFAASIPKAVLLMAVVERIRFNRLFEEKYIDIRLSPVQLRIEREHRKLRNNTYNAKTIDDSKITTSAKKALTQQTVCSTAAFVSKTSLGSCTDTSDDTRRIACGERTLPCKYTSNRSDTKEQQQQKQDSKSLEIPRRIVTRSFTRKNSNNNNHS